MKRRLELVNLVGVLALALLCVVQWRNNRALNLEISRLQKAGIERASKLADHEKTIAGQNADLDTFRAQLIERNDTLKTNDAELANLRQETQQLRSESEQLKNSIKTWSAAVHERDTRLKEASSELQRLANERDTTIQKFNDLATKHNAIVADLNEARLRLSATPAQ